MANTQINIGANGTTTLATAGKFCDRNIDVNVAVPANGITPSGTKTITSNGLHDVSAFANAQVNVPAGITPSGTKTITENGLFDISSFANAQVNIQGLNARVITATVSADVTSGTATILASNDWIKSIRSNPNAFVIVRYLGVVASTASSNFWFNANFQLGYSGATKYNTLVYRQTASTASTAQNVNGLTGTNYGGHISVETDGGIVCSVNSSFPVKAGTYQIIAGTIEML